MSVVDTVLMDLLTYDEVLGAIVLSREGLPMGSAGMDRADVDYVGAMGATLIGTADQTARRIGAGAASGLSVTTEEGQIHIRVCDSFAVLLFTEPCDTDQAGKVCDEIVHRMSDVLTGVAA